MDQQPTVPAGFPRPFGSYTLLNAFAHGGMGEVYLAKTGGIEGIERLCVVKKLRPDVGHNAEYANRFLDEARLAVQLNHANVAHVFDVGKVGDELYLAMEFVSGVSLRALLARCFEQGAMLPEAVALFVLSETLEALDYAHRSEHPMTGRPLNLVHRDVSPHNVMVSYEGEVKLIDFGLAASELKEEHTASQVVMGKVAYMAPEQARGERVDGRCDQFAAAVVAYELFAGDRFYGEMSNYEIWQVVGRGGFTPRRWAALDPALQRILATALHGDPALRFGSCGDFKDALTELLIERHPKTTRRMVRNAVRSLFAIDTERERRLLFHLAQLPATGGLRLALPPVSDDDSVSAPLPPPQEREPRGTNDLSGTQLVVRTKRSVALQRRRLVPRVALLVTGVLACAGVGVYLVSSSRSPGSQPPAQAPAAVMLRLPAQTAAHEPAPVAELPSASLEEEATVPSRAPQPAKDSSTTIPVPPAPPRAPAPTQKAASAPDAPIVATVTPEKPAAHPVQPAQRATPAATEANRRNEVVRPASSWQESVVERLHRCAPCGRVFLRDGKLRIGEGQVPTSAVRLSLESCLRQCEEPR
jgi:serine/threonine-protein kinase